MNERIRELAEQAGIVFWEISGDVDWRQANREHLEEFAELIVKECVDVASKYDEPKMSGPGLMIGHMIEQHFGVLE